MQNAQGDSLASLVIWPNFNLAPCCGPSACLAGPGPGQWHGGRVDGTCKPATSLPPQKGTRLNVGKLPSHPVYPPAWSPRLAFPPLPKRGLRKEGPGGYSSASLNEYNGLSGYSTGTLGGYGGLGGYSTGYGRLGGYRGRSLGGYGGSAGDKLALVQNRRRI